MYQLYLSKSEYEKFKKEAKVQMLLKGISIKDLAERTGYSEITLYNFFSSQNSRFVAYAINEELEIRKR